MKKIGLNAETLFAYGSNEHNAISGKLINEVIQNKDLLNNPENLKAALNVAKEEAIIRTVAKMIEENNAALLKDLKNLGVILDR